MKRLTKTNSGDGKHKILLPEFVYQLSRDDIINDVVTSDFFVGSNQPHTLLGWTLITFDDVGSRKQRKQFYYCSSTAMYISNLIHESQILSDDGIKQASWWNQLMNDLGYGEKNNE